jgi:hypothetical protein
MLVATAWPLWPADGRATVASGRTFVGPPGTMAGNG